MYLIDTDIIISGFKGHETVTDNLRRHRTDPMAISVVTYGEMVYGARKSRQVERNLATAHRVAEIYPMLQVTRSVIETFAGLRADLQMTGSSLDDMDLLIAATALSRNLTLVTNNEKRFSRVPGLPLVNWANERSCTALSCKAFGYRCAPNCARSRFRVSFVHGNEDDHTRDRCL